MSRQARHHGLPRLSGSWGPWKQKKKVEPTKAVLHVATLNKAIGLETGYGPIETVIHGLDKGLHNLGYRSIVACSADAIVNGEKHETVPESLGAYCSSNTEAAQERIGRHLASSLARSRADDIDVVHMHEWYEHIYSGSFNPSVPIVMTLHVPGSDSGMVDFHDRHPATPLASKTSVHWVAISEHQRRQYAGLIPIEHTIPHGIDVDRYEFGGMSAPTPYLFSIGRLTQVKGQDTAIEVAKRSGTKLILAGCVQNKPEDRAFFQQLRPSIDFTVDLSHVPVDAGYYDRVMKPILSSDNQIVYVGELNDASKKYWYRHALATVFPIRWGEPFGMVLIESMASGTPVLAFREGAVPEILADGKTGFIVDSVEAMVRAVGNAGILDRRAARKHVERHFSVDIMARRYAALYEEIVHRDGAGVPSRFRPRPSAKYGQRQPVLAPRRVAAGA